LHEKAKELGLWGIARRIAIGKSGTSLIIRIPKDMAQLCNIQNGGKAFIYPEGKNRICLDV
jgi:antitoxin component of MazEF toxin-antitoxin module